MAHLQGRNMWLYITKCCILHSDTIWQIAVFLTACIRNYIHNTHCIIIPHFSSDCSEISFVATQNLIGEGRISAHRHIGKVCKNLKSQDRTAPPQHNSNLPHPYTLRKKLRISISAQQSLSAHRLKRGYTRNPQGRLCYRLYLTIMFDMCFLRGPSLHCLLWKYMKWF
jgi:hypothetical protein